MRRLHRLRASAAHRELFSEARLSPAQLCLPLFVHERDDAVPIEALAGVSRWPVAQIAAQAKQARALGIRSVLVFGVPEAKSAGGTSAADPDGPAARAIKEIKDEVGDDLVVLADTCMCSYTDTGHCAIFKPSGTIDLSATLDALARAALTQAEAGADFVAPSDMMDGHVAAIRAALDQGGCGDTGIISYAAKYASAFYGPFREAAASAPTHGDRRGYQIDPGSRTQALASIQRDLEDGADAVIVKPGLPCLDVLSAASSRFDVPVWAYQVSGEYAMLKSGVIDERQATLESLTALHRGGAGVTITYAAMDVAAWLNDSR